MKSWVKKALVFVVIIVITAGISVGVTISLINSRQGERIVLNASEYQLFLRLAPLAELLDKIKQEHYGDDITDDKLIDGALKGMLESTGDPYSRYYTDEEYTAYLEQMDGKYHGIGALVGEPLEEGAPVLRIFENSPAQAAGLVAGDIITSINGIRLERLSLDEIEQLFYGDDDTEVEVGVLKSTGEVTLNVKRITGMTVRVVHKLFNQRTGYIKVDKFTGSAADEFLEAIRDLEDRGMKSLVIDLRNNPGGDLKQVVTMVDEMLGDSLIVSIRTKNGEEKSFYSDANYVMVPLAVLVNENSASASELFAAAIQDSGRGIIVGMNTYGKGVVQTTMRLETNFSWVKFTTACYYTPNGRSINGKGVIPDIEIELADEIKRLPIEEIQQEDDAQLWAALDVVREQAEALEEGRTITEEEMAELPDEEETGDSAA